MANAAEILKLCRLCLVKDQVTIPIFDGQGDVKQIFLKITACLPIKVSRKDCLPKSICNACLLKLEVLYEFWNTTANSEKTLITWLNEAGVDTTNCNAIENNQIIPEEIILKEEAIDVADRDHAVDDISSDAKNYASDQQAPVTYNTPSFEFQNDILNAQGKKESPSKKSNNESSAKRKRAPSTRRRTPTAKAIKYEEETEEESAGEDFAAKVEDDSDYVADNDTSIMGFDQDESIDEPPPTSSASDQPGPSGVQKATGEPPCELIEGSSSTPTEIVYECEVCSRLFAKSNDFQQHYGRRIDDSYVCCKCDKRFDSTTSLYEHREWHKNEDVYEEEVIINVGDDIDLDNCYTENVETAMDVPANEETDEIYILDDTQCANEVIIEDNDETSSSIKSNNNYAIVKMEHGYMLPSIFKGQLESRPRPKKREINSSVNNIDSTNASKYVLIEPTTSKIGQPQRNGRNGGGMQSYGKKRHEIPDFSPTDYVQLKPNDEVDVPHFKCLRCEQLFINKFTFFRHIEKGKCFINQCDVCTTRFDKNSDFYEHYVESHTDRAICNFCFRTFMYEKNVKEHMLRHLDQFRHRCEECNKGFYTIREYRNHYKNRHMGIRHQCVVCGRSFADEYYFKRHTATHTNDIVLEIGDPLASFS